MREDIIAALEKGGLDMPRPVKPRWVEFLPNVTYFKPAGIPLSVLDEVSLGIDELEALRLKHVLGLEQEECAERMKVAQSTFQRILSSAHSKVAEALVEGKAIRISGGHFRFPAKWVSCPVCGHRWQAVAGHVGLVCPACGHTAAASDVPPGEGERERNESGDESVAPGGPSERGHGWCRRGGRGRNRGNGFRGRDR